MVERRDLPLFAWGHALRAARARRMTLRRRAAVLGVGITCLGLTIALPPLPRLVWNATASAPIGLYAVSPGATLERGDMVIAWPPVEVRHLAASRRYLPANVPLVKRVVGIAGDTICGVDRVVTVNGRPVSQRAAHCRPRRASISRRCRARLWCRCHPFRSSRHQHCSSRSGAAVNPTLQHHRARRMSRRIPCSRFAHLADPAYPAASNSAG